jgi:hypothetical protein
MYSKYPYIAKSITTDKVVCFLSPDHGCCLSGDTSHVGSYRYYNEMAFEKINSNLSLEGYIFLGIGTPEGLFKKYTVEDIDEVCVYDKICSGLAEWHIKLMGMPDGTSSSLAYFVKLKKNSEQEIQEFNLGDNVLKDDDLYVVALKKIKKFFNRLNTNDIMVNKYKYIRESSESNTNLVGFYSSGIPSDKQFHINSYADLDRLEELIQKKKPQLPVINDYTGEYIEEENIVQYGCAKIDFDLIETIVCTSTAQPKGNRFIKSITLNSDVEITFDQLQKIYNSVKGVK